MFALAFDERLVWDRSLQILFLGALLALALGSIDDIRPRHWGFQLSGQLLLGLLLVSAGMTIRSIHLGGGAVIDFSLLPFPALPLLVTLFWVVLVMNAVNWVDGADGLMAGVTATALLVLALLSLRPEVNQPALALLALMLFGSLLGFLAFNWHPAVMVAGTGGSAFLGFMIAALSVYAGAKVATALLVLAIPILDALSVIVTRIQRGRSPFLPDRSHFHHALLSLGWSPRQIALTYVALTGAMGLLSLSTRSLEKVWVLVGTGVVFFVVVAWMQWILNRRVRPS